MRSEGRFAVSSVLFLAISAFGQSNFATVSGRIEDESHASVAGARVTAKAAGLYR